MVRTFIAIEIPANIQNAIYESCSGLRQTLNRSLVRWVPPQNIHLTLKFLGDIPAAALDRLKEKLPAEAACHQPFTIEIGKIGVFPSLRRPRVIWIGIKYSEMLLSLQRSVETVASQLGIEAEKRPFSAHLTIGRVKQQVRSAERQRIGVAIKETKISSLGKAKVDAVHLFRSELKPGGAVYTSLHKAKLHEN